MNGVKVSTELQQQIMQMFKNKQDARTIGKELGIHAETVLKYLKENSYFQFHHHVAKFGLKIDNCQLVQEK